MSSRKINFTSSTLVQTGPGSLEKLIINSHSTGTFKLIDGTNYGGTAIGGTYTPATGSSVILLEPLGFNTGLYIAVGGTADLTAIYNGNPLR